METRSIRRICVFCGSASGSRPEYLTAAREFGTLLAERGYGLVYGGAQVGLMGEVANAAMAAGGEVIGVIPHGLMRKEVANEKLADLRVVNTMHERKAMMAELSDAFVALPGGCGTFEELFEVITWAQIAIHDKPIGVLNVANYYAPLIQLMDHAVEESFVRPAHRSILLSHSDPAELIQLLLSAQPVNTSKWGVQP